MKIKNKVVLAQAESEFRRDLQRIVCFDINKSMNVFFFMSLTFMLICNYSHSQTNQCSELNPSFENLGSESFTSIMQVKTTLTKRTATFKKSSNQSNCLKIESLPESDSCDERGMKLALNSKLNIGSDLQKFTNIGMENYDSLILKQLSDSADLVPGLFDYYPVKDSNQFYIKLKSSPRDLLNVGNYVNPFFQIFGGSQLGIPIAPSSVGITASLGTPYSAPLETDFVKAGLQLFYLNFSVTTSIKEFVIKYSSQSEIEESRSNVLGNWNNLYTPKLGFEVSLNLPFLNLSYFTTVDTLDYYDPPVIVRSSETWEPMKNNVVKGDHFNFELRMPYLEVCGSERSKFYFARLFKEYHLGYEGKQLKLRGLVFDTRFDFMIPGERDYQFLYEFLVEIGNPGFETNTLAFGPSLRFGQTPTEDFGFITAFLNFRLKVGELKKNSKKF